MEKTGMKIDLEYQQIMFTVLLAQCGTPTTYYTNTEALRLLCHCTYGIYDASGVVVVHVTS